MRKRKYRWLSRRGRSPSVPRRRETKLNAGHNGVDRAISTSEHPVEWRRRRFDVRPTTKSTRGISYIPINICRVVSLWVSFTDPRHEKPSRDATGDKLFNDLVIECHNKYYEISIKTLSRISFIDNSQYMVEVFLFKMNVIVLCGLCGVSLVRRPIKVFL